MCEQIILLLPSLAKHLYLYHFLMHRKCDEANTESNTVV
jgi:hypothetical protein